MWELSQSFKKCFFELRHQQKISDALYLQRLDHLERPMEVNCRTFSCNEPNANANA